ncbi:hypothetical protein [Jongsikchunia kroppenstedtii]|uniref:hypothetical protein n=1 Tax=Jongsikchunia kroppenstedtii TaxID=1121721 RepID=UPI00037C9EE6|nr:hypothetical protein [Jongsikchunia kroppenstedtii]
MNDQAIRTAEVRARRLHTAWVANDQEFGEQVRTELNADKQIETAVGGYPYDAWELCTISLALRAVRERLARFGIHANELHSGKPLRPEIRETLEADLVYEQEREKAMKAQGTTADKLMDQLARQYALRLQIALIDADLLRLEFNRLLGALIEIDGRELLGARAVEFWPVTLNLCDLIVGERFRGERSNMLTENLAVIDRLLGEADDAPEADT